MKLKTKDVALMGVMGGIIALISLISIPTPLGIPLTLQIFAISICGFLFGAKSALAVCVWLILGALGLPVFSGGRGGFGEFFSLTGGFLWSFPIFALFFGIPVLGKKQLGIALGLAINYAAGIGQFAAIASKVPLIIFALCLCKDILLVFLAQRLSKRIKRADVC